MRKIALSRLPMALLWATTAAAGDSTMPAEGHKHHAHHEAHTDAGADSTMESAQYATDAPLRAGMRRIHGLLAAARPVDTAAAQQLSEGIDAEVKQLFAQCKLEPAADAALHGVLALLLEGSAGLRAHSTDDQAWDKLQEAMALYPMRFNDSDFDDPGFDTRP